MKLIITSIIIIMLLLMKMQRLLELLTNKLKKDRLFTVIITITKNIIQIKKAEEVHIKIMKEIKWLPIFSITNLKL